MRRLYEITFDDNSWTLGVAGVPLRGFESVGSALAAAMATAHEAEKDGEHVTIFLSRHGQQTQVYESPRR